MINCSNDDSQLQVFNINAGNAQDQQCPKHYTNGASGTTAGVIKRLTGELATPLERDDLHLRLGEMFSSTSWRITAPTRFAKKEARG